MKNVSTASAVGKSRLALEVDLVALTSYLESERAFADAATSAEEFLALSQQRGEVCHA